MEGVLFIDTCLPCWFCHSFQFIHRTAKTTRITVWPSERNRRVKGFQMKKSEQHVGSSPIQNTVFQVRLKCQEINKYILIEDLFQDMVILNIMLCYLHFKLKEHLGSSIFLVMSFVKSGKTFEGETAMERRILQE